MSGMKESTGPADSSHRSLFRRRFAFVVLFVFFMLGTRGIRGRGRYRGPIARRVRFPTTTTSSMAPSSSSSTMAATSPPSTMAPSSSTSTTTGEGFRGRFAFVVLFVFFRLGTCAPARGSYRGCPTMAPSTTMASTTAATTATTATTTATTAATTGEGFRGRFALGFLDPVFGFTREQVVQKFTFGQLEVEPGHEVLDC